MSIPPLRRPKCVTDPDEKAKKCFSETQYVIVTLNNNNKLVVSSDSYNGLINAGNAFKCTFCNREMDLDHVFKEYHKKTERHIKAMAANPNVEEYGENLIRKLWNNDNYCTICNMVVSSSRLETHLKTDTHQSELEIAISKVKAYKNI